MEASGGTQQDGPGQAPLPPGTRSRRRSRRAVRRRRLLLGATAALIPLAAIIIVIVLVTGGSAKPGAAGVLQPLQNKSGALATVRYEVATVTRKVLLRFTPDGVPLAVEAKETSFGSPAVLLVRRTEGNWLGVVAYQAGNNKLAWLPTNAVKISYVSWHIDASLKKREIQVFDGTTLEKTYKIAIGRPDAPTPTGYFAVTDRLLTGDATGPYGCCILALSAVAPHAIQGWDGGDRVAIHSTPETWSIGKAVSHGCMRLTLPEGRWLIEHVPLGSPAIVRSD